MSLVGENKAALTRGGLLELPPVVGCSSLVPAEEVVLVDDLRFAAGRWLSRHESRSWSWTRWLRHSSTRGNSDLLASHCHIPRHVTRPHVEQGRLQEIHVASSSARARRRRRPRQRRTFHSDLAHLPRVKAQVKGKARTAKVPTQLRRR
jgi:hypothetical protein